jgi:serine/threonine-protein kinase
MPLTTSDQLIEELRSHNLLSSSQLSELEALPDRPDDSRELAKVLVKREWLTRLQANVVYQGRAKELFLGPYVLLDKLGEGGMGEVFRARHSRLERIVALKLIRTEKIKNKDAITRFQREARAAAQLTHPNIVTLFDDGQEGNIHYLAMEYIKGVDLSKWVREKGAMPVAAACNFIRQAALGLQHAHEKGMVHRDIKPSNLMLVAGTNQIKVLDMGLARIDRGEAGDGSDSGSLTQEGAVMGTPDFLAPEQAMNAHRVDIRADIYSLGCSLYYVLTAKAPFSGGTLSEKLLKHHLEEATAIRELRPDVPEGLAKVVARMMAKKAEQRYQTPAEVAVVLAPFCKGGASAAQMPRLPAGKQAPADTDPPRNAPTVSLDESVDVELIGDLKTPSPAGPTGSSVIDRPRSTMKLPSRRALVGWAVGAGTAVLAIVAAILVVVVFLNFLGGNKEPETVRPPDKTPPPVRATTLDDLKPDNVAVEERLGWVGEDVVAVLGTHKWRHWAPVKGLAFFRNGSELVSFGDDDRLRFCDAKTGAEVRTEVPTSSPTPTQPIREVVCSPDGQNLATLVAGKVTVYAYTGRELTADLPGSAIAYSSDGKMLAVVTGAVVNLYSADGSKQLGSLRHAAGVTALAFQPKTNLLATFTAGYSPMKDKTVPPEIKIWDLSKEPIPTQPRDDLSVEPHNSRVLVFAPDGSVISGALDAVAGKWPIFMWDVKGKKEKARISEGHTSRIWTMALTSDGRTLLTGSVDGSVRAWNMENQREKFVIQDMAGPVHAIALSPDDKTLAVGGQDNAYRDATFRGGAIRLYDVATGKEKEESLRAYESWIRSASLSPDRTLVALGQQDKSIKLLEAGSFKERGILKGHNQRVLVLRFSSDSRQLFSGSLDKSASVWDLAKAAELPPPFPMLQPIDAMALAPDGQRIAVGTQAGGTPPLAYVKTWEIAGRKEASTMTAGASVLALDYFPDTKALKVLSGTKDGTAKVWDSKGVELAALKDAHPAGVNAVAVCPKGPKVFVTAGEDGTLKVWDATQLKSDMTPLQVFKNNMLWGAVPAPYRALAFSADGKLLAAGDQRGGLTLYDTSNWKEVRQYRWPGGIQQLSFDSWSKHLVCVNNNGTAYILRPAVSK